MSDWITTDEAAELSGYSTQYVRRLIRNKKLLAENKGGQYWVSKQALLDYLESATEAEDKRHGPKSNLQK
jgi:excisionase family DNA binding protein